jgi:hypothetical protein
MQSSDRTPAHLRNIRVNGDTGDQSDLEISGDGDRALTWGWISGKPVFGVSFEWPGGLHRSFRYMHLESDMTWQGDKIVMRFSGMRLFEVTIKGLRLEKLYYLLQDDRMRAVRQAAQPFDPDPDSDAARDEAGPFVEKITIEELEPSE